MFLLLCDAGRILPQCCPAKPDTQKRQLLWKKLQAEIRQVDQQLDGVLAVAVKDLTSGDEFLVNGDEIMPQASSIKIAILGDLYFQAQQGKVSLSEAYTVRRQDLVPGSDVLLGLTPDFTRLNLRDLASIMVAVSDNSAANILIDRLGFENINAMLEGVALHTTRLKRKMMDLKAASEGRENIATAREMMTLLQTIYQGKLLNKVMTADFFKVLQHSQREFHPSRSS